MTDYLERARIARDAKLQLLGKWLDDMLEGRHAPPHQPRDADPVPEPG